MPELANDLKEALTPSIVILNSQDFENEADMEAHIRQHPAKHVIKVLEIDGGVLDGDGVVWKKPGIPGGPA